MQKVNAMGLFHVFSLLKGCNSHVVCVLEAVVLCQIFQKKDAQSDEENLDASMLWAYV